MPGKSDTSERMRREGGALRSSRRLEHRISVAFSPDAYDPNSHTTPPPLRFGQVQNISHSGLCFDAPGRYQLNQVISLYLRLTEDSRGITMLGKVIWMEPQLNGNVRLGIQFIGSLPADWQKLLPNAKLPEPGPKKA